MANSVLTVYVGGTLTLASCFQDIGLAIAAQNPMTADATGRLPIFYVDDGTYRVRLVDETGVQIYDYPQVASIGASSSGGGGSAVDPTTVFQTGDPLWQPVGGSRSGWVRMNARTIGSATSGASERANTDCQALFLYLWNNYTDAKCPVVSGRGVSAAADWAANKKMTLPDLRGRGPWGIDGMGNARANILGDAHVSSGGGDTADTGAASGGSSDITLGITQIPSHDHNYADSGHNHGVTDPGHSHAFRFSSAATQDGSGVSRVFTLSGNSGDTGTTTANSGTGLTIAAATTGITFSAQGGGASHDNMPPFYLGTWWIKL